MRWHGHAVVVVCSLLLAGISFHFYRSPIYSMDLAGYMGNALLMQERDISRVHEQVYRDLRRTLPPETFDFLTGKGGPPDESASRRARFQDAGNFAQFLPFFAIRPLYNLSVYWLGRVVGLIPAVRFITSASYFLLGLLTFTWMSLYAPKYVAAILTILLMVTPPLTWIGRDTGSDALATLVAFLGLYLIFERERFAVGVALLSVSLWIRTDNLVLLAPVLLVCWWQRRIELWKAVILGAVGVASVLAINHYGGDYGIKMLYYRNFVEVPLAPAEMTVQFSLRQYVTAFGAGVRAMLASYTTVFLFLGIAGWRWSRRVRPLIAVTTVYVILHYLILPNWQERWFGVFYLAMGIAAVAALGERVAAPVLEMGRRDRDRVSTAG